MKNSLLLLLLTCAIYSCKKEEPTQIENITNEYYTIVECDSVTHDSIPEEFVAFHGLFEGEGIGAAVNLAEDILILFNHDGDRFAWFEDQEIQAIYELSANNHCLEGCPFEGVAAATITYGNRLVLFNEDGDEYIEASFDPENTSGSYDDDDYLQFDDGTSPLSNWGSWYETIEFNSIGALWNFSYDGYECFDAYEDDYYTWMIDGNGDEVVRYASDGYFYDYSPIENWTAENNCGGQDGLLPFESIGAACRYVKPNNIREIFFNEEGTQFTFYNVSEGVFSEIYDLY